MSNIDLDSLFSDDEQTPKPQVAQEAPTGPAELVLATPASARTAPKSLAEVYDQYLKRIYLFDCSGSMNSFVVGEETIDMFDWPDRLFEYIERTVAEARTTAAAAMEKFQQAMDDEGQDDEEIDEPDLDPLTAKLITAPELEPQGDEAAHRKAIQEWVIQNHLFIDFGMSPNFARDFKLTKRMDLIHTSALNLIKKRFDQYPNADVLAAEFDTRVEWFNYTTPAELFERVANIKPCGGTDILTALTAALNAIKKQPSVVGMNHIIIVTDAESGSHGIADLLPRFKETNTALDFIHITNPYPNHEESYYRSTADELTKLCAETKGEYTKVTTANEFEVKFLAASSRLLLPPGA